MDAKLQNLAKFYIAFTIILFAILIGRLGQLQLFQGEQYFLESEKNRIRDIIIPAQRGLIFDRNGEILVENRPSYSISVIPYEFRKSENTLNLLSSILEQQPEKLLNKIQKEKIGNFSPVKIKRQISFTVLSAIEEYRLDLPGVFYNIESKRFYPDGVKAPHLFGYLGETTSEELSKLQNKDYRLGDVIGKNGIELEYENYLRGKTGVEYVEVDVLGREVRNLAGGKDPILGKNLYLTIDARIQRYLEKEMTGKRGAAVVLDPRNGDVLALLSKPDYDPEIFSNPLTPEIWDGLVNHEEKPLYNRACLSLYPPGSTYKLVLAAAGLETNKIHLKYEVFCKGAYRLGTRDFRCWKRGGHGWVDFLGAIEQSCNVYFYKTGLMVGLDEWSKYSKIFQFGRVTGIDLPNESAGNVPSREYFDDKYGKKGWTKGLLLNLSVGQGDLLTTPLQMAYFAMILGNEGLAFQPRLLKKIVDPVTREEIQLISDSLRVQGISEGTFGLIKRGMFMVVNGANGTAKVARVPGVKVCGKTGSAQNPHGDSHAWFIGYAPMEKPQIAICIFVENGGSGGAHAAPLARGILDIFFSDQEIASR